MTQVQQNDPARLALAQLADKPYGKPSDVTTALAQLADHFPVVAPGGTTRCPTIADGCNVLITSVVAQFPERGEDGKEVAGTGDVFQDRRTRTWCFKHSFLKKLAAGAGIEWIDEERMDNFRHPFVCAMKVKGRYRDYSGEWRQVIGSHMLDLRDEAEHGMATTPMLKAARATIQQRCASMAKSRAIADACVSRTIAEGDIGRPIIMAKLYRTDAIDPNAAREALYGAKAAGAAGDEDGDGIEGARSADAEIIDHGTGEVTRAPAPAAKPAAEDVIPKGRNLPGEGKTFAQATPDELAAYIKAAKQILSIGKDAKGQPMPEPHMRAATAKMQRAIDELDRRRAPQGEDPALEDAPW